MTRSRTLAVALATSLLVLASCGDDGGGDDADEATTTTTEAVDDETTTTTEAPDDETTTTTEAADGEGIAAIEELAAGLLITLDELGNPDFIDAGYTPLTGPNACGFDLDAEHPSEVLVGTTLGSSELVFQQEIRVYASAAEAEAAFEAGVANTTCATPTEGVVISEPLDVTEEVGADRAVAFNATAPNNEATLIAAVVSDALVSFQFGGLPGAAEAAGAPNPIDVSAFGIGKILAALEEG